MKRTLVLSIFGLFMIDASYSKEKEIQREYDCIIDGSFNEQECIRKSSWIAVGEIKQINYKKKNPANLSHFDYHEFVLSVSRWEKGNVEIQKLKEIQYLRVFHDDFKFPSDTTGLFRVYGSKMIRNNNPYKYHVNYLHKVIE